MAPAYKLTYFNGTAMGEITRWLFCYANIEFEDERFSREEWVGHKSKMPFAQMPVLTCDGKMYNQSLALGRYAAKQAKLVGANDIEELEIDGAVLSFDELKTKTGQYAYEKDEARKETLKAPLINETLPFYLERLENIAKANGGHLACKKLTWADFYFASMWDYMTFMLDGMDFLAKYPNLQKVRDNVISLPQIKKWLAERPKGMF